MGHPTNDDLKAIVAKAALYKKAEEDRIKALIAESSTRIERLEEEFKRLEALIPWEAYREMQEDERRMALEVERDKEKAYFDRAKAEDAASQIENDRIGNALSGALFGFFLGWVIFRIFG